MAQVHLVELSDGTRTYMNDRLIHTMMERQRERRTGPGCHGRGHRNCRNCTRREECAAKAQ